MIYSIYSYIINTSLFIKSAEYLIYIFSISQIYYRRTVAYITFPTKNTQKKKNTCYSLVKDNVIFKTYFLLYDLQQCALNFDFIQCSSYTDDGHESIKFITHIPTSSVDFVKTKFMSISFNFHSELHEDIPLKLIYHNLSYYIVGSVLNKKIIEYLMKKHTGVVINEDKFSVSVIDKKMKITKVNINDNTLILFQPDDFSIRN
jgi:hypothetical protein